VLPADQDFCYLTTIGRRTGKPHEIEIWYGMSGSTAYMLCGGGKADWVKNIRANSAVKLRISGETVEARGRIVEDPEEDSTARTLLLEKYKSSGEDLTDWGKTALPVAIDFDEGR
jgi:deazaflavin-dependent oxidoreductase (nitroreductase family)